MELSITSNNPDLQHPGQILKKDAIQGDWQRQSQQSCDQVIAKSDARYGERVIECWSRLQKKSQDRDISDRMCIQLCEQPHCPLSVHLPQGIATDQADKPEGQCTRNNGRNVGDHAALCFAKRQHRSCEKTHPGIWIKLPRAKSRTKISVPLMTLSRNF